MEKSVKQLEDFSTRLQYSGHSKTKRNQIIWSALNPYDRILEKDERGEYSSYKHRELKKNYALEDKRMEKDCSSSYKGQRCELGNLYQQTHTAS